MIRKILFTFLFLGIIIAVVSFFIKQPGKTIIIGEYEAMSNIEVLLDELNIVISNSADDKIHVQAQGYKITENLLAIKEENDRFIMTEQQQKKKWLDYIHIRQSPTIIVQLPEEQLEKLILHNGVGSFTINHISLDTIQVHTSSGNGTFENIDFANADIQSKDGKVTITQSDIGNLKIQSMAGDVAIIDSRGSAHSIQTGDGQIKITGATEQANVDVKSISGDIAIHYKNKPSSLQLTTAGEDIRIKLSAYDKKTQMIGDGVNKLSVETKYGLINIKE